MKTPLFLSEMCDISMFKSLDDIERYIEPYGLEDGRVFDAEGTEFALQIVPLERPHGGSNWYSKLVPSVNVPIVRVVTDRPLPTPRVEFEGILREYLSDSELDTKLLQSMCITDMVSFLERTNHFTR